MLFSEQVFFRVKRLSVCLMGYPRFGLIILSVCLLSSCANIPVKPQPVFIPEKPVADLNFLRHDVLHIVGPGETLWRISKIYDVPAREISSLNHLDPKNPVLKKGQRLLIRGAAEPVPVISLYRSKKWKYIIIHHSATDEGDSLSFDKAHLKKGWDGVGYHFVIDNGSQGKNDGLIEVSPRWLKNKDGSHCKASGMNTKAIGICLVGNFSKDSPSAKQMASLVYLTNRLRNYYGVPLERIMEHGQVPGAKTECPGKRFPWNEFKSRLRSAR